MGDKFIPDEEGMVFSNPAAALAELRASARDLLRTSRHGCVEMRDAAGTLLGAMPASGIMH